MAAAFTQPAPGSHADQSDGNNAGPTISPPADREFDENPVTGSEPVSDEEATDRDYSSSEAISPSADGATETGDEVSPAVSPDATGVTETGDQVSPAISPSASGATDASGRSTPPELPLPKYPLYPGPSDDGAAVVAKVMPNGATSVTLHMDDLDVRKALELLSRQAGVNILVSPRVSGSVTVDLRNVTLDQALQAIVKLCNLSVRHDGDLIYVRSVDEESPSVQDTSGGLKLRVYRLNYARGIDLMPMVKPLLSPQGRVSTTPPPEIGIKSDTTKAGGNTLAVDDVLVVRDYEPVLKNTDSIVAKLDVQPEQVLIEAVILSVKLKNEFELGVNYAVLGANAKALTVIGSGAAINSAAGFTPASLLTAGGQLQGTPFSGTAAADNGIKFGFVDKDVTGFIKAMRTVGETKILATPRLLVLSKQRAEIQLGDRLGFRTLTQTQTSTVQKIEFMNVGTQLRLRPFVSTDGMVRMEIHPERSSGEVVDNVPSTHTAEVTTNVMVPDGSTIVIGGLIDHENENRVQGIPGLMSLPYVGPLFRLTTKATTKQELIVLLTPRIWEGETAAPDCVQMPKAMRPESISAPCAPQGAQDVIVSDLPQRGSNRIR